MVCQSFALAKGFKTLAQLDCERLAAYDVHLRYTKRAEAVAQSSRSFHQVLRVASYS